MERRSARANLKRAWLSFELLAMYVIAPGLFTALFDKQSLLFPAMWLWAVVCLVVLLSDRTFDKRRLWLNRPRTWARRSVLRMLALFVVAGGFLAAVTAIAYPEWLFDLPRRNPRLMIAITILYPIFSVYPQEIIWRAYFFHRYWALIPSTRWLIVLSALLFGYAHLMFPSPWFAISLCTLGGVFFGVTYLRTRSVIASGFEHALYGCFLFAIGLGRFIYTGGDNVPPPGAVGSVARVVEAVPFGLRAAPVELVGPEERVYDGRFIEPEDVNGVGVLLIGGGYAWDMHWTTPGSAVDGDGNEIPLTIDGSTHRDGDRLAFALAREGCVVLQFSGIRRDDPIARQGTGMATPIPIPASVELTRAAFDALRAHADVDRIVLIGHSLGAVRAAQMDQEGVGGMVFLSGAYVARAMERTGTLATTLPERFAPYDADGNHRLSEREFRSWIDANETDPLASYAFSTVDSDGDGSLAPWELVGHRRVAQWRAGDTSWRDERPGFGDWDLRAPEDVVVGSGSPVLLIFGGLDGISMRGPIVEEAVGVGLGDRVLVEYVGGLGHNLSPEEGGLVGPMDDRVIERVADWVRGLEP